MNIKDKPLTISTIYTDFHILFVGGGMNVGEVDDRSRTEKPEKKDFRKDPFIKLIENPAHISLSKSKKIDLEKIEDGMWSE